MQIAFVTETYPPEINGVALTVARAVAFLREQRHGVDVVRPSQAGESHGDAERDGGSEWRSAGWPIPVYREARFGVAWPAVLARRFARAGTQLVHVATEGPLGRAAVIAARRLGLPVTSDFRTNFHRYSRYYGLGFLGPVIGAYLRNFHNATDCTFVPTTRCRDELALAGFDRLRVVGRGVDLERFSPLHRDAALRLSWGHHGSSPVLLYVGRLAAEKKVELALQAFRRARAYVPLARMVVVGDGPRRVALERDYPEVRFIGMQTGAALAACYASADLFVFPSESETFGNVTLEALASGLPVVAFDSAAAAEHVVDRVSGRLVAPGDDDAFVMATCLATTLHDFSRAGVASIATRRSVEAQSWPAVLERFERQLLEVAFDAEQIRYASVAA